MKKMSLKPSKESLFLSFNQPSYFFEKKLISEICLDPILHQEFLGVFMETYHSLGGPLLDLQLNFGVSSALSLSSLDGRCTKFVCWL